MFGARGYRNLIVLAAMAALLLITQACAGGSVPAEGTAEPGQAVTVTPGTDGEPVGKPASPGVRIAFVSDRGGKTDLWVMGADGSNQRQLTSNSAEEFWPAWSPDGVRIAYSSKNGDLFDLWVVDVDSGKGRRLAQALGTSPGRVTWAADGSGVYLQGVAGNGNGAQPSVLFVPADDGAPTKLVQTNGESVQSWSLGSGKLAAELRSGQDGGIYVGEDLGTAAEVKDEELIDGTNPILSPDGRRMAFRAPAFDDDPILWVVDLDTGKKVALNEDDPGRRWDHGVAWSPDGKRLAFARSSMAWTGPDGRLQMPAGDDSAGTGDEGIYLIGADGTGAKRITSSSLDANPAWSADGNWLAFVSGRSGKGKSDIWVVQLDGKDPGNLTKGQGNNWSPAWSTN